uniref:Transmembrane protein n=1 Tax=Chloropicon primus TaxID=1764295 RepID=A0A7S2T5P9_9CHLO|mmetsp:Transcript_8470/g.24200  ORF Transcript_8470/g.24200 Transcript_8470/m.24200 type:complete len:137 (+) Transcript_8470:753-1163(+)
MLFLKKKKFIHHVYLVLMVKVLLKVHQVKLHHSQFKFQMVVNYHLKLKLLVLQILLFLQLLLRMLMEHMIVHTILKLLVIMKFMLLLVENIFLVVYSKLMFLQKFHLEVKERLLFSFLLHQVLQKEDVMYLIYKLF